MAFFKFRKQGDEQSLAPSQPESIDTLRKRAKYRLIGAAVLVLGGVIGFPLLFDQQPRPIAVDMPIDIPDRNKVAPLAMPAPAAPVAAAEQPKAPAIAPVSTPSLPPAASVAVAAEASAKPETKATEKPSAASPPVLRQPTTAAVVEDAKARALLEGRDQTKETPAAAGRFVVQVGAFADAVRAREVRLKMEKAGLKTYTHVAETKEGPRIRVRVGPFDSKAEADSAAEKIKKLDLPAAILTL